MSAEDTQTDSLSDGDKNAYVQASRELRAIAEKTRWTLTLAGMLEELGGIERDRRARERRVAELGEQIQAAEAHLAAVTEEGNKAAEDARQLSEQIVAEARVQAEAMLGEARAAKAEADDYLQQLAARETDVDERIKKKEANLVEVDSVLRRTKEQLAKIRKSIVGE